MSMLTKDEVLRLLGASPEAVGSEIGQFAEAAKVFSSDHPRLIDAHPMEWVGVFQGRVEAAAEDLDGVKRQLTEKGIPPAHTIIRFIDKEEKTFLL